VTTRERTTATSPRPRMGGGMRTNRTRYVPKRKVCFFCANKNEVIDYKSPEKLRSYVSDMAKIDPRRRTGTCAKHQRAMATAIKRARHLALLPYTSDHSFTPPVASGSGVMNAPGVASSVSTTSGAIAPAPVQQPPTP
jgi:small subunit ribosomal protein S18